MDNRQIFLSDDFDRINNKYFNRLRESQSVRFDPSYWIKNFTEVALEFEFEAVKNYKSDFQFGLKEEKPIVISAFSEWDTCKYRYDDITVCSSATTASLIILAYLKDNFDIKSVFFESPCYFGSLKQAQLLGLNAKRIPTYYEKSFELDCKFLQLEETPKVLWVTQPRFGLGNNQIEKQIMNYLYHLSKNDFLVIDEATEQLYPSHLRDFNYFLDDRIIKIRSPFKPIGINGPRLSTIIHGDKRRKRIQNTLEQVQGAIDTFSLSFTKEVFEKGKLKYMLSSANQQVIRTYKKAHSFCLGTNLNPSNMENGYIGSVAIALDGSTKYLKSREKLLSFCAENGMPVILGANLNFAKDNRREFVRLSYFNEEKEILESLRILSTFTVE